MVVPTALSKSLYTKKDPRNIPRVLLHLFFFFGGANQHPILTQTDGQRRIRLPTENAANIPRNHHPSHLIDVPQKRKGCHLLHHLK